MEEVGQQTPALYNLEYLKSLQEAKLLKIKNKETCGYICLSDEAFEDFLVFLQSLERFFPEWDFYYSSLAKAVIGIDGIYLYNKEIQVVHQETKEIYPIYDCFTKFYLYLNDSGFVYFSGTVDFHRTTITFAEAQHGFNHPHNSRFTDSMDGLEFTKFCFGTSYFGQELMRIENRTTVFKNYNSLFLEWTNCLSTECEKGTYFKSENVILQKTSQIRYLDYWVPEAIERITEQIILPALLTGQLDFTLKGTEAQIIIDINKEELITFITENYPNYTPILFCISESDEYFTLNSSNYEYQKYAEALDFNSKNYSFLFRGTSFPEQIINIPENNTVNHVENLTIHPNTLKLIKNVIQNTFNLSLLYLNYK